jgi:hypothetical protein
MCRNKRKTGGDGGRRREVLEKGDQKDVDE